LDEFDEMLLCLKGAAELCDDTEMFQLVFDELSTTVMDRLRAKQTNDAQIDLASHLDGRPKNIDSNEGDQPLRVSTPSGESNLQAALRSARDKQQNCEYADAIHEYQRALALSPDIDYVKGNLAFCMANACVWDGLEVLMEEIKIEAKSGARVIDPFCAALLLDDPKLQRQVAEAFSNGCFPESPNVLWRGENYHHSRMRVAYLSADYHGHATAYLIAELLESHNKDKFETYGISYGKDVNYSMRSRLSKAFDHFIDVNGKNDREVAELMRAMEIDIAIDLKGFTPNSRPGILANRPCPVQAQYLGFPGTMGSSFIDYIIADHVIIPESHEPYFSEKVLRFTGTYQPTTDVSNRSEHKLITRSDEGLPSDGFVYCCFNNNYKITPEIFDVWMNILRETPGSVLWLLEGNEDAPGNLRCEALKRGIEPERLIFAAKKSVEDHLARHQLADLFLDTAPCNAHTTASDALNAGLPVLTLMGDTFASRVAASVGQSFDSGLTVARDLAEYTQIAVQQQPGSVAERRSVATTMAEELEKMFQGALQDAIERASDKGSCLEINDSLSVTLENDLGIIRKELNAGIGTLNRSAIEALESYPVISDLVDHAKCCANQILTVDIDSQMERRNPTFHTHTNVLFNIAVAYCQPEDVILEIGVWRGHTPAVIHFIDPTLKYIGIDPLELVGQAEDVRSLISKLGENYVVEPEYSSECAFKLLHLKGSVQIIHIDGAHDSRNVFNDFMLYRDLLKPNGILIFDDYLDFKHSPQVKPIIDDLKRYGYFSDFIEIGVTDSRSNYILVRR
jgi:predicted O-linked N-acetylglucosamine transferase (SPINDLY family)